MKTKDWMKIGFGLFFGKYLAKMVEDVLDALSRCAAARLTLIIDDEMRERRQSDSPEDYAKTAKFVNRVYGKTIYPEHSGKKEEIKNKIGFDIT